MDPRHYALSSRSAPKRPARMRMMTTGMRAILAIAAALVFTIGIPLTLVSERMETAFAWTIPSYLTAAFLGASYWSAGILEYLGSRETVWANGRVAVPAVFLFTVLTLVVTLLHIDRFHFGAPAWHTVAGTWAWLVVYAVVPILLLILFVQQMRAPGGDPPRTTPIPLWVQVVLWAMAVVLIPLGVALLMAPVPTAAAVWPWELTPLTGRAVGAWLFSVGVAAAHSLWERDWTRIRPATRAILFLGLLQGIALARYPQFVLNWNGPAIWVYVAFLVAMVAVGVAAWLPVRRASHATAPA